MHGNRPQHSRRLGNHVLALKIFVIIIISEVIAQIKAVWLWHWSATASKPTREGHYMPGKGKFGKLGGGKSCSVVYGSARSSECEAHGPSATATI